jgi:hypothetical protein
MKFQGWTKSSWKGACGTNPRLGKVLVPSASEERPLTTQGIKLNLHKGTDMGPN